MANYRELERRQVMPAIRRWLQLDYSTRLARCNDETYASVGNGSCVHCCIYLGDDAWADVLFYADTKTHYPCVVRSAEHKWAFSDDANEWRQLF